MAKRSSNRLAIFSAKTVPSMTVVTTCHIVFLCRVNPADLHHPQPPLHKKGLQTTLQTSRQSLARGLVDSGQRPPSVKVLVWLSSLCPCGVRHDFIYSRKHSCVPPVASERSSSAWTSQASRARYRTSRSMFPRINSRKHSARGGL